MAIKQYSKKVSAAFFSWIADRPSDWNISRRDTHEFNRVIFDISHAVSHRQRNRNGLTNFPAV
jgi:hypothetical protein